MRFFRINKVYAHCDIPCGIYDPHAAQLGALTALRMLELIHGSKDAHDLARYVSVKEKAAEQCKEEVRILWGDFFKAENASAEVDTLSHNIMSLASAVKQGSEIGTGQELVKAINQLAEIFWAKKGIRTKTVPAPYKVEGNLVIPEL